LHAIAVENPCLPGTPDVNYKEGWIELKWLRSWPKNEGTPVQIPHYSQQQKLWIRKRHVTGGKVFLLLQCKKEWFLFKHPTTMVVGNLTRKELTEQAHKHWANGLKVEEFIKCIT